ncbi:MAG: efflux RND transporter periplasmic adaptor subunit [Limisphaerales bacterium]
MNSPTIRRLLGAMLATGVALASGCKPGSAVTDADHGHSHDGGHEHEEKTAQITVWTDRYEVFAEHKAPVAGQPTTFITHVTDLVTLEPRREGMVKFLLRQGPTATEHPQAAPARAGIYLPALVFPQAGDWQLTLVVPTDGTNIPVELGTIKVYADQHAADHADIPDAPEGVSFLKEQQWKILSRTELATRRTISERMRLPGRIRAKPGGSASVTAPVSGQLLPIPEQASVLPGQRVAQGQLLGLLAPNFSEAATRIAEAEADFATAKAGLEQAEAAYSRTRRLAAEKAKSERELQEAELAVASARARHAAAVGILGTFRQTSENRTVGGALQIELRAPIAGVLVSVAAGPGELLSSGQAVFSVINPETVWVEAAIPEAQVPRLGSAKQAAIENPEAPGLFIPITGENRGRLLSIGAEVNAATRTVPLLYEAANPEGKLRIGQSVTLHVETAQAPNALAIPESALVEEGDELVAFVQISGETFEKREIKAGVHDTGFVQVLDGIQEGERVVTKGAYAIRLSTLTGVIPAHGHAH